MKRNDEQKITYYFREFSNLTYLTDGVNNINVKGRLTCNRIYSNTEE